MRDIEIKLGGFTMKCIFQTTILLLALVIFATTGLAGDQTFPMPKDMTRLLPVQADGVLGISSLEELDGLWLEVMPLEMGEEDVSLLPVLKDLLLGFEDMIDPGKPLLLTTRILSSMDNQGVLFTLILPMKDEDQDLAHVEGFEKFLIVREGDYIGVSTDPDWQPAGEKPTWAKELKDGLLTASLDLESIVETYGCMIEMGLGAMESQAQGGTGLDVSTSVEESLAMVRMLRALVESVAGMEIILNHDDQSIGKDFIFSTKPGSPFAPGPQPSFEESLNLTRFMPGGEELLVVAALDQSAQMDILSGYYLATIHSEMATMDSETAERYALWYTDYLNAMEVGFLPTALTIRFEKDNSSFQNLILSGEVQEDWQRLIHIIDGLHDLGIGVDLSRIDGDEIDGHEILGWAVTWQEGEIQNMFDSGLNIPQDDPLLASELMGLFRFVPGNIYMSQVDDYILTCGGSSPDLMKQLVRNVAKGKGQVDPRVKKALKKGGSGMQMVTVGDLNAIGQVLLEIGEEFSEEENSEDEFSWPIDHPLPFQQWMEINGADYLIHLEMEKSGIREMIQALIEVE